MSGTGGDEFAVTSIGLTKRFRGGQVAVDHIDLAVPHGAVYGFLGPNGSGKTTTIRMLLGLVRPTEGSSTLLGGRIPADSQRVLPRVGALVEGPAFHPYLSGRDNLAPAGRSGSHGRPGDLHRADRRRTRAGRPQRRRRASGSATTRSACASGSASPRRCCSPDELLILDEPTNGLDPQGTREVRSLVTDLAAGGVTVLLSTHLLSEVEQICTHVGVMHVGRLVAQSRLDDLRARTPQRVRVRTHETDRASTTLAGLGLTDVVTVGDEVTALLGTVRPETIIPALVRDGVPVIAFGPVEVNLEDVFVTLTGEGFGVSG